MIYDMIWYMISYDIYDMIYNMIWYVIYFVNCNRVATRWQQYSTHLHTNSTQNSTMKQNTQNGTYITIRILVTRPEEKWQLGRPRRKWCNIKMDRQAMWHESWIGLIWLSVGTSSGLLWTRWWTSGFIKIREISWLAEALLAFQEGLFCMELVCFFQLCRKIRTVFSGWMTVND
jgi:hypothetical protein